MTRFALLVACAVAGCAADAPAPTPPQVMAETFASCAWGEVEGARLSIWAYDCGPNFRLVADDALPGFAFEGGRVAIRSFEKPPGLPISSALDAIRAASPGPHTETCVLTLQQNSAAGDVASFVLSPTGDAKEAWDAALASDGDAQPPCGPLGVDVVGDRAFFVLPDKPEVVAFVDFGSEIQIFDVSTLRAR
jgi:hypothetical protein